MYIVFIHAILKRTEKDVTNYFQGCHLNHIITRYITIETKEAARTGYN